MRAGDRIGLEARLIEQRRRRARQVGLILDLHRLLRRHEVVLELQDLRNTAQRIAGGWIDRNAHQVIAGGIDQIAVGVQLEIARAREIGDAAEVRLVVGKAGRLRHDEEAVAADRHVGRDAGALDRPLHGVGGDAAGDHSARGLLSERGRRDQILKGRVGFLVAGGLRIRDVAGNILQRERLCLQTSHRAGQCIEDTHDLISNSILNRQAGRRRGRSDFRPVRSKPRAEKLSQ
jgi:hypothetical protein